VFNYTIKNVCKKILDNWMDFLNLSNQGKIIQKLGKLGADWKKNGNKNE
jgi:hypothetical protein